MGKVAELLLSTHAGETSAGAQSAGSGAVVAELLEPPGGGVARIRVEGGPPLSARCTADLCGKLSARGWQPGQEVLVLFENGDRSRPIAVDLMAPVAPTEPQAEGETMIRPAVAEIDGREVMIRGEERVELRCGKASILIRSDGKVIVRGTHLLSRSSGPIRLKGGHVDIN